MANNATASRASFCVQNPLNVGVTKKINDDVILNDIARMKDSTNEEINLCWNFTRGLSTCIKVWEKFFGVGISQNRVKQGHIEIRR